MNAHNGECVLLAHIEGAIFIYKELITELLLAGSDTHIFFTKIGRSDDPSATLTLPMISQLRNPHLYFYVEITIHSPAA